MISEVVWKISLKSLSNARPILLVNRDKETSNMIMTFLLIQIVRSNIDNKSPMKRKRKGEEAVAEVKKSKKKLVLLVSRRKQNFQWLKCNSHQNRQNWTSCRL